MVCKVSQVMVFQEKTWKGTLKLLTIKKTHAELPMISFFGKRVAKKNKFAKGPAKLPIIVVNPAANPIEPPNNQSSDSTLLAVESEKHIKTTLNKIIPAIQFLKVASGKSFPIKEATTTPTNIQGKK